MEISIRGWSRNRGTTFLFKRDLSTLRVREESTVKEYQQQNQYLIAERDEKDDIDTIRIVHRVEVQASGAYLFTTKLTYTDVMYLAWIMMKQRTFNVAYQIFGRFDAEAAERRVRIRQLGRENIRAVANA